MYMMKLGLTAMTWCFPGVPRLLDLVRVRDNRLKVAFCYAFGNTVVANDLDQASRIAYGADKRWSRVVTIQVRVHAID
jgi:structural maintenance of chromosome 4